MVEPEINRFPIRVVDTRKRGPQENAKVRVAAREKAQAALRLRRAGVLYPDIADRLDYSSRRSAQRAVERELMSHAAEDVAVVRQMEVDRLDALLLAMWKKAIGGDGWSVDRILRIMERRSRLLGLDEPMKQQIEVITESVLDEEIARLTAELNERGSRAAADDATR